ncbi:PTS sugar transporter subunit IIB [Paramicrobacterium chengjingii]|uniref:PTS sugar transporter subunit IIB n=1 Tax=Paramicrobacterium chengjingii TaxID=2769067 RepID=A0ABX6YLR8_9MICO|nr:PTS sugar transporter subunit IIB [Microbacterium chengjingii]QPZ39346.1 PTS sugar transporter subunit IIB [Microbacterium chengjingii]
MKRIVTLCGVGIGTAGILKVNAERVLTRLGIDATVTATDVAHVQEDAADAQVILTSPELVKHIGPTFADVVEVNSYVDLDEIERKLDAALG